jgi:hypothetical protein
LLCDFFLFSNALLELLAECASQAHITHRAVLDLVDAPRPAASLLLSVCHAADSPQTVP